MNNGIAQRQNETQNIVKLAAQRHLYSKAKLGLAVQLILSVPIIIIISIINLCLKSQNFMDIFGKHTIDMTWLVATFSVLIAVFDRLYLSSIIEKLKERAAKIQELFDCDVLELSWNEILVGKRPDLEDIIDNTNKYSETKKDIGFRSLLNWYPKEVDRLPIGIARIICQRSNMRWDAEIRKNLSFYIGLIAVIMGVILLIIAILGEVSLKTFFEKAIAPCLPIWIFSIMQIQQNKKAIISLGEMKQKAETAWDQAIKLSVPSAKINEIARQLQDSLFLNRKTNPLIFEFIYKIYRPSQESSMNYSCKNMVEEYERK